MCLSALRSAGWSGWRSLSWTASAPGGCSVSCCARWPALEGQPGPWAGPAAAACDWCSGAGSELAEWIQRNLAAGESLKGTENCNNHYNYTAGKQHNCGIKDGYSCY